MKIEKVQLTIKILHVLSDHLIIFNTTLQDNNSIFRNFKSLNSKKYKTKSRLFNISNTNCIEKRIYKNKWIINEYLMLIDLCIHQTTSQFIDTHYSQGNGTTIGNPVFFIANIIKSSFKKSANSKMTYFPKFRLKYW